MLTTGHLHTRNARLAAAVTAALLISLALCFAAGRTALAAIDFDGDGATDTDCRPYDSAVAPGKPDAPDLQHEDTNCDGIDGDRADAVWAWSNGSDTNNGTFANPKKTIGAALATATSSNKDVYIMGGTYSERIILGSAQNNVGLYGGYVPVNEANAGARQSGPGDVTISPPPGSAETVLASGVTGTVLQELALRTPGATSGSVYGVRAVNSTLALEGVQTTAGSAGNGTTGPTGASPSQASSGQPGRNATDCNTGGAGGFGGGGFYFGGNGGAGGRVDTNGAQGVTGGGPGGGAGGSGGQKTDFSVINGGRGGDGSIGTPGQSGNNAGFTISSAGPDWRAPGGTSGLAGTPGSGGGGGGGGAGRIGFLQSATGGGGGGGGGGGQGGGGGTGGQSGGGSFGVYLWNSTLAANDSAVQAGSGGGGGNGGVGGFGGGGGTGGPGGTGASCGLTGGNGGNGGNGGRGGNGGGGGGGAGGPSVGIFVGGTSAFALGSDTTTTPGTAGAGGLLGGSFARAENGAAAAVLPSTPQSTTSDFDGDGVPDTIDACLTLAGTAADGCRGDTTVPRVKKWTPTGTGISPLTKPAARFSEPMNGASVERTFKLKRKGTTRAVGAVVTYTEATTSAGTTYKAVLVPNSKLRAGATYVATITSGATDAAGNPLVAKTWRFTVTK